MRGITPRILAVMLDQRPLPQVAPPDDRTDAAYRRDYQLLAYLARRRLHVPVEDVAAVIHETFVAFLENAPKIGRTAQDERSWLIGTLYNVARYYWRKRHPAEELPADLAAYVNPEQVSAEAETRLILAGVLRDLPTRCRDLLRRRYAEGYTPEEIAVHETLTRGSTKNLISKCLLAARAAFERLRRSGS